MSLPLRGIGEVFCFYVVGDVVGFIILLELGLIFALIHAIFVVEFGNLKKVEYLNLHEPLKRYNMLMSHNPLDQEVELLISFISSAKEGNSKFLEVLKPIIREAKELADGSRSVYELGANSVNLKLLLEKYAHDWLIKTDVENIHQKELVELYSLINENKNYVFA